MRRRTFITLLGGAAVVWPLAARAQQAGKLLTIGFMGATPSVESQRVAAFVQRLRELGWVDGRNLAIEYRWAEGRPERVSEIAAEFVMPYVFETKHGASLRPSDPDRREHQTRQT
jgi:putative ABC transport system substrate-binding protein